MNKTMLITLYCIVNDVINVLAKTVDGRKMLDSWKAKRGSQRQLSLSEVIALNIMSFYFHIFDLKAFVSIAGNAYKAYFPRLPNSEGDKHVISVYRIAVAIFFAA